MAQIRIVGADVTTKQEIGFTIIFKKNDYGCFILHLDDIVCLFLSFNFFYYSVSVNDSLILE